MRHAALAALVLLAVPVPGPCAEVQSAVAVQDLLDVYELARRQDPDLASARAAAGAAEARYRQARGQLLPQLSGNASFSKIRQDQDFEGGGTLPGGGGGDNGDDFEDQQSLTLDLQQPLFDWSAWQAKDAASARAEQAERELAAADADLMVRTARAYFDVLAAEASLEAAQRRTEVIQRQLDRARAAYESGLEPVTDLQQAQSALDSARVDVIGAQNALANSRDALSQLTGMPHSALAMARPPFQAAAPPGEAQAWVERALGANPQLAAQQKALAAAEEDISQARGGHFPTVALTGSVGESEQVFSFPGVGNTTAVTETTSVGIQVSVPIFAGGSTRAAVDEAQFTAVQSQQELVRTRRQTEVDTRTAFRDLAAAAARVQALKQAITSGETAAEAARAGLATGTRNILDVLEAETDLIDRRVDLKQAWYDYAVAGLRLKQAAGELAFEDLQRINARLSAAAPAVPGNRD